MRKNTLLDFGLLYFSFAVYSVAAVCSKLASIQTDMKMTILFIVGEIAVLALYAMLWQHVLKRFPLIVAMSSKGITVIFGLLWSVLLFREHITTYNVIGSAMVILGIGLVSTDG